jgi:hypothetical protein
VNAAGSEHQEHQGSLQTPGRNLLQIPARPSEGQRKSLLGEPGRMSGNPEIASAPRHWHIVLET